MAIAEFKTAMSGGIYRVVPVLRRGSEITIGFLWGLRDPFMAILIAKENDERNNFIIRSQHGMGSGSRL